MLEVPVGQRFGDSNITDSLASLVKNGRPQLQALGSFERFVIERGIFRRFLAINPIPNLRVGNNGAHANGDRLSEEIILGVDAALEFEIDRTHDGEGTLVHLRHAAFLIVLLNHVVRTPRAFVTLRRAGKIGKRQCRLIHFPHRPAMP